MCVIIYSYVLNYVMYVYAHVHKCTFIYIYINVVSGGYIIFVFLRLANPSLRCFRVFRPAIEVVATSLLVHIASPRVMLRKQYDGRASLFNNGVEPTVKEVQMNLLEAMYGATSSSVPSAKVNGSAVGSVSLKKAIRLLQCLDAGVIDPYWSMVPYRVSESYIYIYT